MAAQGAGATSNVAEYAGAIAGLRALLDLEDLEAAEVRGDSQLVVRHLTGEWYCRAANLVPLHREALDLARRLEAGGCAVTLRWIPREENAEADELSKQAYAEARAKVRRRCGGKARMLYRTYHFEPDTIAQIEETAARFGVARNDLVHFCVRYALGEISAGRLEVSTRPLRIHRRTVLPPLSDNAEQG
jgi:ribonuclease HI